MLNKTLTYYLGAIAVAVLVFILKKGASSKKSPHSTELDCYIQNATT